MAVYLQNECEYAPVSHFLQPLLAVVVVDKWSAMQPQASKKQSKSARRRAVKAAEKRDIEAAGMWQKVQHRNKASINKVAVKGGASGMPTITTQLLAVKGQGASVSNQPKGSMPNSAKRQGPKMVHTNSWTISARNTNTAMPAEQVNGLNNTVNNKDAHVLTLLLTVLLRPLTCSAICCVGVSYGGHPCPKTALLCWLQRHLLKSGLLST